MSYQCEIAALKLRIRELTLAVSTARYCMVELSPCADEQCKQQQSEELEFAYKHCTRILNIKD